MPATASYRILASGASQRKACAEQRSTEYPRDLRVSIKLERRYLRAANRSGRVALFGDRQMRRLIWPSTADARNRLRRIDQGMPAVCGRPPDQTACAAHLKSMIPSHPARGDDSRAGSTRELAILHLSNFALLQRFDSAGELCGRATVGSIHKCSI